MARVTTRKQVKLNVSILRIVLSRICSKQGWFSLREVASGIDRSVHSTFISPPARRLVAHLVEEDLILELDNRYLVRGDEALGFLRKLQLPTSKTSHQYLVRFAEEVQ